MKIACPRGQVKIEDCLYPSALGYVTSQSLVSILHCMYMHSKNRIVILTINLSCSLQMSEPI